MLGLKDTPPPSQELAAPVQAPDAGKQPYLAYHPSGEEQRYLEIRLKFPDSAECPSNAMLTTIRMDWRMGIGLTLEYGNPRHLEMMVIIRGENLQELYKALREWKVEWIAEFSPDEHKPPTDGTAPFIRSIDIYTERPEKSPPAGKRH